MASAPSGHVAAEARKAWPEGALIQSRYGNGPRAIRVVIEDEANRGLYDALVQLLRAREGAARLEAAAVRGDPPRRRSGVPPESVRPDGRLDGAADPHRRRADRRLHGALA